MVIISGIVITVMKRYCTQLWLRWVISIARLVLMGTTHVDTHLRTFIGFEILVGAGFSIIFSSTYFPVLAPLPLESTAWALAFYAFLRQFFQVCCGPCKSITCLTWIDLGHHCHWSYPAEHTPPTPSSGSTGYFPAECRSSDHCTAATPTVAARVGPYLCCVCG